MWYHGAKRFGRYVAVRNDTVKWVWYGTFRNGDVDTVRYSAVNTMQYAIGSFGTL